MSPAEAVAALRRGEGNPIVWQALDALVRQRVGRVVRDPSERDDIAQNVLFKFAQQARNGVAMTGERDGEVIRYIDVMARNCGHDGWRAKQRTPLLSDPDSDTPDPADSPEQRAERARDVARALQLFEALSAAVIAQTPAAHRDARQVARQQVETLYLSDLTVDDLVTRDLGLDADAPADARQRAANRLMKQHQRYREAMLAMADERLADGSLDAEGHGCVVRMVTELKRK